MLNENQIIEVEEACSHFKGDSPDLRALYRKMLTFPSTELDLPFEGLSPQTFPLPTLGNELRILAEQLTGGVGFFHIRGLNPQRYSSKTNIVIYLGISSYIGEKRGRQDELGNMLRA